MWSDTWNISYIELWIWNQVSYNHRCYWTHKWPAPNISGFIAQLVRASHRYLEVTGSNPVEVLTFSGFYTQLLKLCSQLQWSQLTWFQIFSSIYEMFHISLHIYISSYPSWKKRQSTNQVLYVRNGSLVSEVILLKLNSHCQQTFMCW